MCLHTLYYVLYGMVSVLCTLRYQGRLPYLQHVAHMPLQRSDAILDLSDPNIVLGPHKCHPTEHLLENRDPLASKKVKYILSSMPTPTCLTPTHTMPSPGQTTNHAESSDDRTLDKGQAIVVEDSDGAESNGEMVEGKTTKEDDDAELGM